METDHIVPEVEGGPNAIDNAIPVCFECHAEIHSYNDQHPRGRKFRPEELRKHKSQWLEICRTRPEVFLNALRNSDVGPLQALIDEMEFNAAVATYPKQDDRGCLFQDEQFRRAIREGTISTLNEDLKKSILEAYVAISRANQWVSAETMHAPRSAGWVDAGNAARRHIDDASPKIETAYRELLKLLSTEGTKE